MNNKGHTLTISKPVDETSLVARVWKYKFEGIDVWPIKSQVMFKSLQIKFFSQSVTVALSIRTGKQPSSCIIMLPIRPYRFLKPVLFKIFKKRN